MRGHGHLFAALNVFNGAVHGRRTERRRRIEFLAFLNEVVAQYHGQEIYVVLRSDSRVSALDASSG